MSNTSILFTKGKSPFSGLVAWATGEPFSHVAIKYKRFVIHSNMHGLHVESYDNFSKKNHIYDAIDVEDCEDRLFSLLEKYEFRAYDFGAFLFLGLSLVARRYLKIPLPKSNLWQSTGMFLCSGWVNKYLNDQEDDMATPGTIYKALGGKS